MKLTKTHATIGIAVLALADVVLIALALQAGAGTGAASTTVPRPTTSASSPAKGTTSPSATTPTPSSSNTATGAAAAHTGRVMIAAVDADHAWRAFAGSCETGGASIERTSDGGATWTPTAAPLKTITRLAPQDTSSAFVVGAGKACTATERRTADGGATWTTGGDVAQDWYIDPKDPVSFHSPVPSGVQPCTQGAPRDFAVGPAGKAWVLCEGGAVRMTYSSGREWIDAGQVDTALALSVVPNTNRAYAARTGGSDCAGVQVVRVDPNGGSNAVTSCAKVDLGSGTPAASLSMTDKGGWLAVPRGVHVGCKTQQ